MSFITQGGQVSPFSSPEMKRAVHTMSVNINAAFHDLSSATETMTAAALNGGTLTCISCGAKTNKRGVLPCDH